MILTDTHSHLYSKEFEFIINKFDYINSKISKYLNMELLPHDIIFYTISFVKFNKYLYVYNWFVHFFFKKNILFDNVFY